MLLIALTAVAGPAWAQEPLATPAAAPAVVAPAATCCLIPAGTPVQIQIAQEVGSKTNIPGDKFTIRLAYPITVNGQVVVPEGVKGVGEVVHAAKAGMGGKPGELLVAARYLTVGDVRIPLRGFKLGGQGKDRGSDSLALTMAVGVIGLAVRGGDLMMSDGLEGNAKVASDVTVQAPDSAPPPEAPASSPEGKPVVP